jgi:hypothetical protein
MKTQISFYILAAVVTLVSVDNYAPPSSNIGGVTNTPAPSTNTVERTEKPGLPDATDELFKTVVDVQTGAYAFVNTNRVMLTLKDKPGNIIWSTNIVEGIRSMPLMGEQQIHGMTVHEGDLWVLFGRVLVIVDIKTGALNGTASN